MGASPRGSPSRQESRSFRSCKVPFRSALRAQGTVAGDCGEITQTSSGAFVGTQTNEVGGGCSGGSAYRRRELNSAPIAPKTEETLKCLKKLHPQGKPPSCVPPFAAPRFPIDVVRSSLSSFGPGSAAGLFGYKPLLLQQCVRAESSTFAIALTGAVNHFAAGKAPTFLKRFIAGGVSIALEKNQTSVRLW